jgi:phosphomannomutase
MTGIGLVLQSMASGGEGMAAMADALPHYENVKEKYRFDGEMDLLIESLKDRFEGKYNTDDGIRIDMEEGWIHVRRSNTEPVVRVIGEAGTQQQARKLVESAADLIRS